jgi:hypothetical protein
MTLSDEVLRISSEEKRAGALRTRAGRHCLHSFGAAAQAPLEAA